MHTPKPSPASTGNSLKSMVNLLKCSSVGIGNLDRGPSFGEYVVIVLIVGRRIVLFDKGKDFPSDRSRGDRHRQNNSWPLGEDSPRAIWQYPVTIDCTPGSSSRPRVDGTIMGRTAIITVDTEARMQTVCGLGFGHGLHRVSAYRRSCRSA